MSNRGWNGQGLPPVGTVCEFNSNWAHRAGMSSWHLVTVVFISDETYVVRRDNAPEGEVAELCGRVSAIESKRFRVYRSPEQIAADERLAAINYMEIDAGMCGTAFDGDPEARVWVENLIDKGWRKQVSP